MSVISEVLLAPARFALEATGLGAPLPGPRYDTQERWLRAWDLPTVGVVFFRLDGRIVDANRAFERMTGWSVPELRARADWRALASADSMIGRMLALEGLAGRGETATYENQFVRSDGSRWWGLCAPGRLAAGREGPECVEFVIDITASKSREEALRKAGQRNEAFHATLAHELRDPLALIRNCLASLRVAGSHDPVIAHACTLMDRSMKQVTRLVDDLLDVARMSSGKLSLSLRPVPVRDLMLAAVEELRPRIESFGHHLGLALPARSVVLQADAGRLGQAFRNLLGNAVKYTPPGGRIRFAGRLEDDEVVVEVVDSGVGIDAEQLPRVFDEFWQADGAADRLGGLGIGLPLTKRLIELHGGSVTVRSDGIGQGATFTVRLPLGAAH